MQGNRRPDQRAKVYPLGQTQIQEDCAGEAKTIAEATSWMSLFNGAIPDVPPLPKGHTSAPRWPAGHYVHAHGLVVPPPSEHVRR